MPTLLSSRLTISAVSLVAIFVIAACGGDSTKPSATAQVREGQFVDSPVAGLRYDAGSGISGKTDASGKFRYIQGQQVQFFIGNTLLGASQGAEILTPMNLAKTESSTNNINSPAFLNRLKLLQSLDNDSNPDNGITLPENPTLPGQTTVNFSLDSTTFASQGVVSSLLGVLGRTAAQLLSDVNALTHFENYALSKLLSGCYVGNLGDFGKVAMSVNSSGSINGRAPLTKGGAQIQVTGTMRGDGTFSFGPIGNTAAFTGETIALDGQAVAVFKLLAENKQGGLITRNTTKFPTFDTSDCASL